MCKSYNNSIFLTLTQFITLILFLSVLNGLNEFNLVWFPEYACFLCLIWTIWLDSFTSKPAIFFYLKFILATLNVIVSIFCSFIYFLVGFFSATVVFRLLLIFIGYECLIVIHAFFLINPFYNTGPFLCLLKISETRNFLMLSGGIERDRWNKLG